MASVTLTSARDLLTVAQDGPLMEAEILPLTGQGKLRVTYDWLYSALNCDPSDSSSFVWRISRVDAEHIALSPRDPHQGMTLYASVRDDWDWYVEVQAAHSADWIRAIGRDETIGFETKDLLIVALKGFNDQYIAVDSQISDHAPHAGFRLRSAGTENPKARLWFLAVRATLQPGFTAPLSTQLTEADVARAYAAAGIAPESNEITQLLKQLS